MQKFETYWVVTILIIFHISLILAKYEIMKGDKAESFYIENWTQKQNTPDADQTMIIGERRQNFFEKSSLCTASKGLKLRICSIVMESFGLADRYQMAIIFNKSASKVLEPECVNVPLKFRSELGAELNNQNVKQLMFPCFGRHNKMRINWYEDDFLYKIYVSAGPFIDSILVYSRRRETDTDISHIIGGIEKIKIGTLKELNIGERDIKNELATLKEITVYGFLEEMESNYIQRVVKNKSGRNGPDLVCSMDIIQKLNICKLIFAFKFANSIKNYKVHENHFMNTLGKCKSNPVNFQKFPFTENIYHEQQMYSCSGSLDLLGENENLDTWWVSAGYRKNSLIIFQKIKDMFNMWAVIENIDFTELESQLQKFTS